MCSIHHAYKCDSKTQVVIVIETYKYSIPLIPSIAPCWSRTFVSDRLLVSTATSNGDKPSLFKLFRTRTQTTTTYCLLIFNYFVDFVNRIIIFNRRSDAGKWAEFVNTKCARLNVEYQRLLVYLPIYVHISWFDDSTSFIQMTIFHSCE